MKRFIGLGSLALLVAAGSVRAQECSSDVPQAEAALVKLTRTVNAKKVARIEVFSIPQQMESPITIYAELIEKPMWQLASPDITDSLLDDLENALSNTTIRENELTPDLRWSVKITSNDGETTSIRVDKKYSNSNIHRGYINNHCVMMNNYLFDWMNGRFAPN